MKQHDPPTPRVEAWRPSASTFLISHHLQPCGEAYLSVGLPPPKTDDALNARFASSRAWQFTASNVRDGPRRRIASVLGRSPGEVCWRTSVGTRRVDSSARGQVSNRCWCQDSEYGINANARTGLGIRIDDFQLGRKDARVGRPLSARINDHNDTSTTYAPPLFAASPHGKTGCVPRHQLRSCPEPNRTINRPRVLWIDDEVHSGDADVRALELEGFVVDCVETGREGVRLSQRHVFDAILLDLRLRDESGLEVLEQFVGDGITAPIVILTAFAEVDTAVAAMKLGAADYRMKPFDAEETAALLRTLIARDDQQGLHERSQLGEIEWLRIQCDQFSECATKPRLISMILRLLLNRRLRLLGFFGCAEALRIVLTHAEMSLSVLACDMRHAILQGVRTPPPRHQKLRDALEKLESAGSKLSQQMFAGRVGLSRAYLSRLLTAQTGRTASEWCRGAVMRVALRKVLETTEQISQIAYDAGYEHPSQFDLHFEVMFGASPTQLRQFFSSNRSSRA